MTYTVSKDSAFSASPDPAVYADPHFWRRAATPEETR